MAPQKESRQMDQDDIERRKHARLKTSRHAIVFSPVCIGNITDISLEGLSVEHVGDTVLPKLWTMDISSRETSLYINKVPVQLAWQSKLVSDCSTSLAMQQVGVRFVNLTEKQKQEIATLVTYVPSLF